MPPFVNQWYTIGVKAQYKSLLVILIPILLAIILSFTIQRTILSNQEFYVNWLKSFGPWFIAVYILIQIVTIVIAPLGGFFIQVGILALLPPIQAVLLIYAVTTPAFFINFFIARKFGRPLVTKLVGTNAMTTVDTYVKDSGTAVLLLTKIFQAGIFDYASYAAGLTQIPIQTFFLINIFGGIPGLIVSYLILSFFTDFTIAIMILLFTAYIVFGGAVMYLHIRRKRLLEAHKVS